MKNALIIVSIILIVVIAVFLYLLIAGANDSRQSENKTISDKKDK